MHFAVDVPVLGLQILTFTKKEIHNICFHVKIMPQQSIGSLVGTAVFSDFCFILPNSGDTVFSPCESGLSGT